MFAKWTVCLVLGLAASLQLRAADITRKAFIPRETVAINEGDSLDVYLPPNARPWWSDSDPFAYPDHVEIWFPYNEAPAVERLGFICRHDNLLSGEVQAWQGGEWKRVAEITPPDEVRAKRRRMIRFDSPITTRALRLVIDDIADLDHDVLKIANWRIHGALPEGEKLYEPSDLGLSCDAQYNVFDISSPASVQVSVSNSVGATDSFRMTVSWETCAGIPLQTAADVRTFSLAKNESRDFDVQFRAEKQGPYRATVSLVDNGTKALLARRRILVGVRDPRLFEQGTVEAFDPASAGTFDLKKRLRDHSTVWGTEVFSSVAKFGRYPGPQFFRRFKEGGGELVSAYVRYKYFEPLPGVYNLEYMDRMVRSAREHDLGLTLGLWWWDFRGPSQYWMAEERKRKRDGSFGKGNDALYSLFSSKYRRHAFRAVDVMLKRYLHTPEVWIWHPHPYGWVDHNAHHIFDFHPEALEAWADYLEQRYRSLDALNTAYDADYESWKEVEVPEPSWKDAEDEERWEDVVRVLDTRPVWLDWLDFYHTRILEWRAGMMAKVRELDKHRGISGTNASGGVGKADEKLAAMKTYDAFYGDQGLNMINSHVRRLVANRRYGLPLRHEDINSVTIGRPGFETREDIVDRVNLDIFNATTLGVKHISYVMPAVDDSAAFDLMVRNDRTRRLVKESARTDFVPRPVGYLHSFLTDRLEGKYVYDGISLYRWWAMHGVASALVEPGQYIEVFSDGCDLSELQDMKFVLDDCSRVLPVAAVDRLVDYVEGGGKLVLFAGSGEKIYRREGRWQLLNRLGYTDTGSLDERNRGSVNLIFKRENPVLRTMVSMPVHYWSELSVPEGGRAIGRIEEKTGAVVWPHGRGEVLLLAGLPGSITEARVQMMYTRFRESGKKEYTEVWDVWRNAERELAGIYSELFSDLSEWAGVEPLFELHTDFRAMMRRAESTWYVYLFNQGPERVPTLRVSLPDGRYAVEAETLESLTTVGTFSAQELRAPGVALPAVPQERFQAVRLRRLR